MQIEKKLSPKNISECKLRILRCSTNCKNRIGNQFENAVIFGTKKRERRWFRIQKTNIIGRLRALVCRLVYAWVGMTGAEGNGSVLFHWHVTPVTVVTRMKFVTQSFLYRTRCEIMFLIFGFFFPLVFFFKGRWYFASTLEKVWMSMLWLQFLHLYILEWIKILIPTSTSFESPVLHAVNIISSM